MTDRPPCPNCGDLANLVRGDLYWDNVCGLIFRLSADGIVERVASTGRAEAPRPLPEMVAECLGWRLFPIYWRDDYEQRVPVCWRVDTGEMGVGAFDSDGPSDPMNAIGRAVVGMNHKPKWAR